MKVEPRGMTLGDAMALSAGVAAAIQLPRLLGGWGYYPGLLSPAAMLLVAVLMWIWAAGMATSAAIGARSMRFGRLPRPGEWLVLLLAASGIVSLAPNQFQAAELPLVHASGVSFSSARWLIAGVLALAIVSGLGFLRLFRSRVPAWFISATLFGISVVAIGGPFTTLQREGPFLLNPVARWGNTPLGLFLLQCCELAATTPFLIMIAVPTMAAAAQWPRRRDWSWTEWAGPLLGLPTFVYAHFQQPTNFAAGTGFWLADQALRVAWLVAVAALALGLVRRWGRAGLAGPAQPTGLDPDSVAPAISRAT